MSVCMKCGGQIPEGMAFCGICGNPVVQEPVTETVLPRVSKGTKAKGFIGMGLSIYALEMGIAGLILISLFALMAVIGTLAAIGGEMTAETVMLPVSIYAVVYGIAFGVNAIAPAIVGKILCGQSKRDGNASKACSVGNGLALTTFIISAVMLVLTVGVLLLTLICGIIPTPTAF